MVLKNHIKKESSSIGQFFTPNYVAQFMIKNLLKKWNETNHDLTDIKNIQDLTVLEPSAGEGIFLKYLLQNDLEKITAYELDENLKESLLNLYPNVRFIFENFLSSDVNEKFDLIIGNPPYLGQNYNAKLFQAYVKDYKICDQYFVGNMDLFYYFIHLGIHKLKPGGLLSFITTNYWITKSKKTGIIFLKPHILDDCFLLQYIDLSNLKLFKYATGQHNCIFVLQKKKAQERAQYADKKIEIIDIGKNKEPDISTSAFTKSIFKNLIEEKNLKYIKKYYSALTNKDLERHGSWNLLFPENIRKIVGKIENFCSKNKKILYLNDCFIIRNGLILIKDDIFIVNEGDSLKIEKNVFYLKINSQFYKLKKNEIKRLKKIYKSKSILPYGYESSDYTGYVIYFNKKEFNDEKIERRNQLLEEKYPILTAYLRQYEKCLRNILINAKENPNNFYFPRRGAFIRRIEENNGEELIDLEPFYDYEKKIFLKYISKENIFGYSEDSYYATSDTYFLWSKRSQNPIDYLFLLAYLNSKLVNFLFKAKNISIKRSKTKLEYGLPIPNLEKFRTNRDLSIISLIDLLSEYLIRISQSKLKAKLKDFKKKLINLNYFLYANQDGLLSNIFSAMKNHDVSIVRKIIDKLLFRLLGLDEKKIDYLLQNYY